MLLRNLVFSIMLSIILCISGIDQTAGVVISYKIIYALSLADELIDSSLSVLSLESGDSLPVHSTSTEKVRAMGH